MVKTWKNDLKGITYSFLPHSYSIGTAPKYQHAHTLMNNIYQGQVEGDSFGDIFTDDTRTTLKLDCASLIMNAICAIIFERASHQTEANHLKSLIIGLKKHLVLNFAVGNFTRFVPPTAGAAIGKSYITDLLNHTMNK